MHLTPNGKGKDYQENIRRAFSIMDSEEAEIDTAIDDSENLDDSFQMSDDSNIDSGDISKVKQVEDFLNETLGEPSLDNLMVVLTAIGLSKISLNLSEDGDQLSLSGTINLDSEDKKITKE
jgi:hypothetical protein